MIQSLHQNDHNRLITTLDHDNHTGTGRVKTDQKVYRRGAGNEQLRRICKESS